MYEVKFLKINKRGGPNKLRGVGKKSKINKYPPPCLLRTLEYHHLETEVNSLLIKIDTPHFPVANSLNKITLDFQIYTIKDVYN